jgi:hypothetical protein
MKNKLLALSLMSLISFASHSETQEETQLREEKNMKILAELGLPAFNDGIKIVPRSMLGLPEKIIQKGVKEENQRKSIGYVKKNTDYPMRLLSFHKNAALSIKNNSNNTNDQSTHLRKNIKDLKLAFTAKEISQNKSLLGSNDIKLLGVSPQGGFHEGKGGWSGVAQFFNVRNIGNCSYSVMNVKASGTSATLAMEDVVYEVNDKATIILVEGSEKSGFIYKIEWYDEDNFHELECANTSFSQELSNSVLSLAKNIDR